MARYLEQIVDLVIQIRRDHGASARRRVTEIWAPAAGESWELDGKVGGMTRVIDQQPLAFAWIVAGGLAHLLLDFAPLRFDHWRWLKAWVNACGRPTIEVLAYGDEHHALPAEEKRVW